MRIVKKILVFFTLLPVYFYRVLLKPLFGSSCKYYPSCSLYTLQAVKRFGPINGYWLGAKRILRCHPFGKQSGGYDPVPYGHRDGAKWVV